MSQPDPVRIRIRCRSVPYRQGFIEVTANVHPGHVNVEAWDVASETDLAGADVRSAGFPDDAVTANTELELTADEAEQLAHALLAAARTAAG